MALWHRGSITHCSGLVAAAVAHESDITHLGIDAEPWRPLSESVLNAITSPSERAAAHDYFGEKSTIHWGLLVFCAKEAAYKACCSRFHQHVSFHEATVSFVGKQRITVHIYAPEIPLVSISGSWTVEDDLLLVAILKKND